MAAPETAPLIDASHLYVSLGGLPILRDVSLAVERGEAVAILGGNGSGKSTLVRTVVGLIPHQEGEVRLFGQPLARFREWSRIGYVPQHSALTVSNATVREIVSSGRLAHRGLFRLPSRRDRAQVDRALALVELTDRASWPYHVLSGGQKQRALIARALATEPELLVMDEPLAGVDLHSQEGLAFLLSRLREDGLGMAIVLHEQGPLASLLDRTITLCDGRMVDHDSDGAGDCYQARSASIVGLSDPLEGVAG